jgi:hypothetical protein
MPFGSETIGRKLLVGTVVVKADSRCFDCVDVRFANENFAQDDIFWINQRLARWSGETSQTRSAAAGPRETLPLEVERVRVWS